MDAIVAACACLPLALAVAAASSQGRPLSSLADSLRGADKRLDLLDAGDRAIDVRTVFSWSFRTLNSNAARLFRLLSLHPGPDASAEAVASLAGATVESVRPLLTTLTRANLLTENPPGRYRLHDLLREYATELSASHDTMHTRRAAWHRVLDHYTWTAHAAARLIDPEPDDLSPPPLPGVIPERLADRKHALAWVEAEYPVLMASLALAARNGFDAHASLLTRSMSECLRGGQSPADLAAATLLAAGCGGQQTASD